MGRRGSAKPQRVGSIPTQWYSFKILTKKKKYGIIKL